MNDPTVIETLTRITRLVALVFFLSSMAGIGLELTVTQLTAPLRNIGFVGRALLANFVCAPLLAVGIARALNLDGSSATGLLLLGLGAGAPFMPKVVGLANGDRALAVALMVLLMAGTVVFLPLILPLMVKGVEVNPWDIGRFLVLTLLLPLVAGLIMKSRRDDLATRLRPVLEKVSTLALLGLVGLVLSLHFRGLLSLFGTGAIFAAVLFSGLSSLAGWWLGCGQKMVLCMGTGLRNLPAALVVSVQNFKDQDVAVMVLVSTLVSMLILIPLARNMGKRAACITTSSGTEA